VFFCCSLEKQDFSLWKCVSWPILRLVNDVCPPWYTVDAKDYFTSSKITQEICNSFWCFYQGCFSWAILHLTKVFGAVFLKLMSQCLCNWIESNRRSCSPMLVSRWTLSNQNTTFIYPLWCMNVLILWPKWSYSHFAVNVDSRIIVSDSNRCHTISFQKDSLLFESSCSLTHVKPSPGLIRTLNAFLSKSWFRKSKAIPGSDLDITYEIQ
jgi:hypothetical protein